MFEKVNKCYEYITSRAEAKATAGTSPENLVLILRAQSILFKRFKTELKPYKYAGYPMLISTIARETSDEGLFAGNVGLLESACELAHLTVDCSPLNAEELRREGGIENLMKAMQRCISVISRNTKDEEPAVRVCLHIIRCFTAAAQFEGCREKIMELPQIISDVCRCLWFLGAPTVTFAAQECVCAFAVDEYLQNHLLQAGVLYHLLLAVFNYDYTLEEGGVEVDANTNAQKFANNIAKHSIRCLARLGGYKARGGSGSPPNPTVQKIVATLITPYLNSQVSGKDNMPVLKLLNSNSETPYVSLPQCYSFFYMIRRLTPCVLADALCRYLMWDNGTRAELTDYLETQQEKAIKTGDSDPSLGADFRFTAHKSELVIAHVFVRIYNEQPTFALKNPKRFALAVIDYVGKQAQWLFSQEDEAAKKKAAKTEDGEAEAEAEAEVAEGEKDESEKKKEEVTTEEGEVPETPEERRNKRVKHTCMALVALRNVIKGNAGLEVLLRGHFKLIFSLLRYSDLGDMQYSALEVIAASIGNKECVANIAEANVLAYLLVSIETLPKGRSLAVEIMHGLTSNPKMLVEILKSGSLLYFLNIYCNATSPAIREATAALFGKMIAEKLRGPKVKITLSKFLPIIFMDAMQDNPEASVTMFEGTHENPELIWNEDARSQVQRVVKELKTELFEQQVIDPAVTWSLPHDFEVVYENVGDDLVVGGVFLSLLIKQPGWVFRKPKDFLIAIMDKCVVLPLRPISFSCPVLCALPQPCRITSAHVARLWRIVYLGTSKSLRKKTTMPRMAASWRC
jgi:DnaJ family protein C protein 13